MPEKRFFRFITFYNVYAVLMLVVVAFLTVSMVQQVIASKNRAQRAADNLAKVSAEIKARKLAEKDEEIVRARLPEKLRYPLRAATEEYNASFANVLGMLTVIVTAQQQQLDSLESAHASSTRRGASATPKKNAP